MPSITYGVITCNFSISAKDSSGNFTISATFTNTSVVNTQNVRLSCSLTDSSPWSQINVGTVSAGGSASGSRTISSGNTDDDTVYCYLIYGTTSTGRGGGYSVSGYVDPTPPTPVMSPITLAISPTTQYMGDVVTVTESGGYYASVSQRQVLYNGSVIGDYSRGS